MLRGPCRRRGRPHPDGYVSFAKGPSRAEGHAVAGVEMRGQPARPAWGLASPRVLGGSGSGLGGGPPEPAVVLAPRQRLATHGVGRRCPPRVALVGRGLSF